jgi:ArsR family transcriptional regulator
MESTALDVLGGLADPVRRRIVALLADERLCTCHLVDELGAKQPTVSHHLRVLRETGVVDTERSGRFTYYRLRPETLDGLSADLAALAAAARGAADRRRPCG